MELNFNGKVVLITGAGSGMGLLSAECFAKEGAAVVLADINYDAIKAEEEKICAFGGKALAVKVDVTNYDEVTACKDAAVETFGRIDVLITCAGGCETRIKNVGVNEFYEVPIDVIDFGIDLNLKGAIYFHHAVFEQMAKQKSGVIISLGSIVGLDGGYLDVAYSASKSALMEGVTKTLARLGAKHNIRAVCVAPGPVMTRPAMANMKTLIGRAAETQEIVDMFMYLASDKAAVITGTTILMDGGRHVMLNKC